MNRSMNDTEIWYAADLMIDDYGDGAEFVAHSRIDDMIAQGDFAGELVWKQILLAVIQLQRSCAGGCEWLH